MSARITLVGASAGTGKTYRLGTALLDAVRAGTPPQNVLATTFTNRAAAELISRGRDRLLSGDLPQQALNLMLARIGTVNAVFGQILADFALQNGRSPVVSVIPDAAQASVFRTAAAPCIRKHAPELDRLADKFEFFQAKANWIDILTALAAAARSNGISPANLEASASRSLSTLLKAFPNEVGSATALDATLLVAAREAVASIRAGGDATKKTRDALDGLEAIAARLERGTETWADWARLSKLEAAQSSDRFLAPVRAAAARHPEHPRLREDIASFIRTMFAAASEAIDMVQRHKRAQGLVDFVDQEVDALDLLGNEDVASRIAADTDLLLVDEFQDTSPVQLALFLRLSAKIGSTLLVGDTKQAIYGFRGADPDLVDAVTRSLVGRADVATETLPTNRRSRPGLVSLVNAVFGAALPALGIPRTQVVVDPYRKDAAGQPPALSLWRVEGKNKSLVWKALAQRVVQMLAERDRWPVQPHNEGGTRPIRGGDIALLVRTNKNAAELADALAAAGLRVALQRDGLLARAECVLATAGLRFIADASDTLALAEIAHVLEGATQAPAWLGTALGAPDPTAALRGSKFALALAEARGMADTLTPAETLDRAVAALDLYGMLGSWGDPAARHANLGALRGLAAEYEAECHRSRLPATASGLAAWLGAQSGAEQPASPDPEAVQVMTYHSSKGLEWPMVVLADMDNLGEARLFNQPVAMSRDGSLDPEEPLAGRWIRLWPWPYGAMEKDVRLDIEAPRTDEGRAANVAARSEAARLLYVAMTRPRDYLVLAPRLLATKSGTTLSASWLDLLPGTPRPLDLPVAGKDIRAEGAPLVVQIEDIVAGEQTEPEVPTFFRSRVPDGEPPSFPPRRIVLSAATGGSVPSWRAVSIGERIPLTGAADMEALGEALHGFFAADRHGADSGWRKALAERLLSRWGVTALRAEDAVLAADRLWQHLDGEYPGAQRRREWPVSQLVSGQILSGRIDLLVERSDSLAVYDHKSHPGGGVVWEGLVAEHAPQLAAYAEVLRQATGKPVVRQAIHLPISGTVLLLDRV